MSLNFIYIPVIKQKKNWNRFYLFLVQETFSIKKIMHAISFLWDNVIFAIFPYIKINTIY